MSKQKSLVKGLAVLAGMFILLTSIVWAQDNCKIYTSFYGEFPTEETDRTIQAAEELYYSLFPEACGDDGWDVSPPAWDEDNRCCHGVCLYGDGIYRIVCREGEWATWPCAGVPPDKGTFYAYGVFGGECGGWDVQCDSDGDGIIDDEDNCPDTPNGIDLGTCSPDSSNPGTQCSNDSKCECSITGNCSTNQEDADGDSIGDVCDNCPENCNVEQLDADQDGIGDVCDNPADDGCGGCGQPACELECGI